ncbi:MAG: AEC family transporter [Bacteroidales bacterium]|nr:AEC family transporter [Bacteroidales bacterium]
MSDVFWQAFSAMFSAIAKVFVIAFAAGLLVRKKIIKQEYIKGLSEVTVKVLLPALIFSNIVKTFAPATTPGWWALPLVGLFTPVIFLGITALFFLKNFKQNLSKLPVAAFQNAGYLVLPIGQVLYPEQFDQFALFVFLYILGFNPSLWSVGKVLITRTKENAKFEVKDIITPPLIANIIALTLVFSTLNNNIPEIIFDPIEFIGSATVPMATFILGATLGTVSFKKLPPIGEILKILFVKYVIIPVLVLLIILQFKIGEKSSLLADFLIIEASAAPASNLIIMVRKYGGDAQQTGGLMLLAYFAAIFIMPLWIAIWKMMG